MTDCAPPLRTGRAAGFTAARPLLALAAGLLLLGCPGAQTEIALHDSIRTGPELRTAESSGRIESIPAQCIAFTNDVRWAQFWGKFGIQAPRVDFSTNTVVALFAGQKPSSGYSVKISAIRYDAARRRLKIEVLESYPPAGAGSLGVLTFPFDIVSFGNPGPWIAVEITRRSRSSGR